MSDKGRGEGRAADDAIKLILDYVKQETVGPLKGLGRFVGFGLAGAVAIAAGTMLLLLGVLRLLQTETGRTFAGDWSWAPYLVTAAAAIVVAGLAAWRIKKGPAAKRRPSQKGGA
jgi:Putative Actinobacterial Holin-X, holin superfamily III